MVRRVTDRSQERKMKKTKTSRIAPKGRKAKAAKKSTPKQTTSGKARAEGLRLFKVAGRPTREQVILVYGERGPVIRKKTKYPQRQRNSLARRLLRF
jgi:hypothetical protein